LDWVEAKCGSGRIVAAGVDTLTEWNSDRSGFRPADICLRKTYPAVANRVVPPAGLFGSMAINGAALLIQLRARFQSDGSLVTEGHPKVCYYALTGRIPNWEAESEQMIEWLVRELGVTSPTDLADAADDRFDAAMSALAELRGLNRNWICDLHALPGADQTGEVLFCGKTHYWWPSDTCLG
jgi:hypothetical protein